MPAPTSQSSSSGEGEMSERARQRAMTAALNAIAREQADTQRYQDKQSQARSGGMG